MNKSEIRTQQHQSQVTSIYIFISISTILCHMLRNNSWHKHINLHASPTNYCLLHKPPSCTCYSSNAMTRICYLHLQQHLSLADAPSDILHLQYGMNYHYPSHIFKLSIPSNQIKPKNLPVQLALTCSDPLSPSDCPYFKFKSLCFTVVDLINVCMYVYTNNILNQVLQLQKHCFIKNIHFLLIHCHVHCKVMAQICKQRCLLRFFQRYFRLYKLNHL